MKTYHSSEENKMTRFLMAALLAAAGILPAQAAGTYDATVGARYVDLDTKGSKGQVMEYDGKRYYGGQGDVKVSNQGSEGLFDFSLTDIGTTEENGYLNIDYKSFLKMNAKWENMHHRQNYVGSGMMINGAYVTNPSVRYYKMVPGQDLMFRRTDTELNVGLFDPTNNARFLTGQYQSVEKKGQVAFKHNANGTLFRTQDPNPGIWDNATYSTKDPFVSPANVDNTKTDLSVGLGTNIKEAGAVSLDLIRSEFKDSMYEVATVTSTANNVIKPQNGAQQMTAAETMFRYDLGKDLALTGALTARQRENLQNGYKMNVAVAAFNAAYKASSKLSLVARLYGRMMQIDESVPFRTLSVKNTDVPWGQGNELDKTTARAELTANYKPVEKVRLKADYKFELNHRRDAPTLYYPLANSTVGFVDKYYADGSIMYNNGAYIDDVAVEDVQNTVKLGGKVELPLGMEVEGDYSYMRASRPTFINTADRRHTANLAFNAALPLDVEFTLMTGYLAESNNRSKFSEYSYHQNSYRTGLDWTGSSKGSFGADASYEKNRYMTNGWMGSGAPYSGTTSSWISTNTFNFAEHGMPNTQRNTTLGAHGRVNLPKGVSLSANGSYTWSVVHVPVHLNGTGLAGGYATNPFAIGDYAPSEVRIARGGVMLEFTPEKFKNLTARASYNVSDWVDKIDAANSGRSSVAGLGASMKF